MKPRAAVPALLLTALLGLAACSGGDDSDSADTRASNAVAGAAEGPVEVEADAPTADFARDALVESAPVIEVEQRSVIRKGDVALRADDVGKAQFDVQRVADRLAGEVTEEETTTDDDGDPAYTRMVLRIPTASFATAMADLKEVAELESASSSEDDVTAKVIDTRTRLAAQRRSIARITVLFDRAQSIRDIMRIESELSRRQAELESLERQAAYLRSETAMSRITVSIDKIPPKPEPKQEDTDEAGFLVGLSAGWGALTAFAVALATAFGALLPWLVLLAILGIPAYLVWRSRRRTEVSEEDPGRTPSTA